jgi:hypothetical protein
MSLRADRLCSVRWRHFEINFCLHLQLRDAHIKLDCPAYARLGAGGILVDREQAKELALQSPKSGKLTELADYLHKFKTADQENTSSAI